MAEYLTLFETMTEYEEYMGENPVFPNVSYTEDDNMVHYLKTKPLATTFEMYQYFIPEFEYMRDALDKIANGYYINIDFETGMYYSQEDWSYHAFPDEKLLEYLRNLEYRYMVDEEYDDNGIVTDSTYLETRKLSRLHYYPLDRLYFVDSNGELAPGFTCGDWGRESYYGYFWFIPA